MMSYLNFITLVVVRQARFNKGLTVSSCYSSLFLPTVHFVNLLYLSHFCIDIGNFFRALIIL